MDIGIAYTYSGVNNMEVKDEDNDVLGVNGIKSIYGELSQNNINDSDESNTIFGSIDRDTIVGMTAMTPFTVDLEMTSEVA